MTRCCCIPWFILAHIVEGACTENNNSGGADLREVFATSSVAARGWLSDEIILPRVPH